MKKFIENTISSGKLYLNNRLFKENAELNFKDNFYTNHLKTGSIKLDYLNAEFLNNFRVNKYKFKFTDNENRIYLGKITGFQLKSEIYTHFYYLNFKIEKYQQQCRFKKFKIHSLITTYKIPFSYLLSRGLESSFGFTDEYIIRFRKPEFSIKIDNNVINFAEHSYFPKHKKPDRLFRRLIVPTIKEEFKIRKKIFPNLNEKERLMNDVMLIISFLFYHRMDWYGYKSELMDKNEKMHEFIEYKDYNKKMGEDYLFEDELNEFEKYFTEDILSDFIQKFRLKNRSFKKTINSFIDELISIKTKNSYKSRLIDSLFLIEAICEFITREYHIPYNSSKSYSSYQEKIKSVINYFKIPYKKILFNYSNQKKKSRKLWFITDYRNQIAHSNIRKNFSWQKTVPEYIKVMKLIRRLIIILIEPKYQDIPFPEKHF